MRERNKKLSLIFLIFSHFFLAIINLFAIIIKRLNMNVKLKIRSCKNG